MNRRKRLVHSDSGVLGGTPVFEGTRVPVKALTDYLAGGHPLADFEEDFPGVSHEQAVAALELAREIIESRALASPPVPYRTQMRQRAAALNKASPQS